MEYLDFFLGCFLSVVQVEIEPVWKHAVRLVNANHMCGKAWGGLMFVGGGQRTGGKVFDITRCIHAHLLHVLKYANQER